MRRKKTYVLGHHAPAPRPRPLAAALLAAVLSAGFLLIWGVVRLIAGAG